MRFLPCLLLATLPLAPALAQAPAPRDTTDFSRRYAATITVADLEKHLRVLASDEYEGRETGQKGQKMAADYIARQFKADGLTGPVRESSDNPFFQHFQLARTQWADVRLQIGKRKLEYLKDFFPVGSAGMPRGLKAKSAFAGFGIEENGKSDYAAGGVDLKGRVVILLQGEPMDERGVSQLTGTSTRSPWSTNLERKLSLAKQKGAAAVILISDRSPDNFRDWIKRAAPHLRAARVGFPSEAETGILPAMVVSPEVGAELLDTDVAKLRKTWPAAAITSVGKKIRLQSRAETTPFTTENVLGYIEGTDRKNELLVLSAHYDHLGIHDGKVYNGADDDGSGTVAIMEMAQAFAQAKKEGRGPRRSLLFLAVTGEEKGLLGSEWYTDHPVFPLENTVVNLNTDMIGRLDEKHANDPNYIYVIGADKLSSELHRINEQANARYAGLQLDYTFNDPSDPNRFYYRSDHYNFARKGIPVAFYFNGVHADYHQETDEVDKILFPKMERITRLIFHTAWELANRDERIKVDSNKP